MKKADNGNRTRLSGLGSQRSTDEPYLQRNIRYYTPCSFILPVLIFTIFTFLPFYLFAYPFYLSKTPNHFRAFQMPSLSTSVVI